MLTGVFLLQDLVTRGEISCGMVVSGEYISHLRWNAAKRIRSLFSKQLASLTLGDAGAAVIVERVPHGATGIDVIGFTTLAEHSRLCLAFPSTAGPGAQMYTRSRTLQKVAIHEMPPLVAEAMATAGTDLSEIDYLIPHQTAARAIRKGVATFAERIGATGSCCWPSPPASRSAWPSSASTSRWIAMGTRSEAVSALTGHGPRKPSARRLADVAAQACLAHAGRQAADIDMLINAGVYREDSLGEPALAALIQEDIGANPGRPPASGRGTFSFDLSNGPCGVISAIQLENGLLHSGVIRLGAQPDGDRREARLPGSPRGLRRGNGPRLPVPPRHARR